MPSIRIQFNTRGFRDVLMSDGMQRLMMSHAADIAGTAEAMARVKGAVYDASTFRGGFGGGRWCGHVKAANRMARRDNARGKTIQRAVRSCARGR